MLCEVWHKPVCAPGTLLPGWYEKLINPLNIIIIILLMIISVKISSSVFIENKNSK